MFAFEGERRRCFAMPIGGVGTGNLAICGDGSLRQWQIHNKVNHVGYVPLSFFAVRWMREHRPECRLLITDEFWNEPEFAPPPTVSDHIVPPELIRWASHLPKADSTTVRACYPIAEMGFDLGPSAPEARLIAWNPLTPGNSDDSSWPVAIFEIELRNPGSEPMTVSLLSCLQNSVGWDGASLIHGNQHPGYGGNRNRMSSSTGRLDITMSCDRLPSDHPSHGTMLHTMQGDGLTALPEWDDLEQLWNGFSSAGRFKQPPQERGESPEGSTWNSAICSQKRLEPGESMKATVVVGWHFPNRYVDWVQWEQLIPTGKSRFYLGNHYALRGDPSQWIDGFLNRLPELREATDAYTRGFTESENPLVAQSLSSTAANLRTNICLWTEDGRFYGFEGGHGASTWEGLHAVGGCCPMNCTHVWNYEQALSELWPDLFRSMRKTDWLINLNPKGPLPHRVTLPVYVKRLWDVGIGGPENPALDGLFAAVLKTFQAAQQEPDWLHQVWPQVQIAMRWVMTHADDQSDGVIRGEQPNTYDIHLYGPNTFIGSQYLAALRAMEEMARIMGGDGAEYRERFESGRRLYDDLCFNGEYYVQRIPEGCDAPYQFGDGCATDQLLGQWWAYHLGLGDLLDAAHMRSAVAAVFRRNFRKDFVGFKQDPRVFASEHDAGLLVCTYEEGQRPKVPLLYSDEVWTGLEYTFASLCLSFDMRDEANAVLEAVRHRYDGRERNPFNEVECGDHYIRALSSWSLRNAL